MTTARKTSARTPARRPDNAPFDFNLDAVEPESELTPWVVLWGGKRWTLCHLEELDCWELLDAARGGEVSAMLGAFKIALGSEEKYKAFRALRLPQYKLKALFREWQRHCGLDENGNSIDEDAGK